MFLSEIDLVGYLYVNNNFMQTFSCSMPEAFDVVCVCCCCSMWVCSEQCLGVFLSQISCVLLR